MNGCCVPHKRGGRAQAMRHTRRRAGLPGRAAFAALAAAAVLSLAAGRGTAQDCWKGCLPRRDGVRNGRRLPCRRGLPHRADPARVVRGWYSERLKKYFARRYRAYVFGKDRDVGHTELGRAAVALGPDERDRLPDEVRAARQFYAKHFEDEDLGSARVYRAGVRRKLVYVIRVTTDGDDGFQEFYDGRGNFLAASRRYIEVVAWGSREWLRAQATHPWDLPPGLKDAPRRTLWGRPIKGFHRDR